MAEYAALLLMDHLRPIRTVADQPFLMGFADGTTHVPDYLMEDTDGRWIVIDVHPVQLTNEAHAQSFAATQRICDELGWEYLLYDQLDSVVIWNLEVMGRYRHPMFQPAAAIRELILASASECRTFGQLRSALTTAKPGERVPGMMHLFWAGDLTFDLFTPLNDDSIIATASQAPKKESNYA